MSLNSHHSFIQSLQRRYCLFNCLPQIIIIKSFFGMNPQLHYLTHIQNTSYCKETHHFSKALRFRSTTTMQTDFKYNPKMPAKSRSCTFGFGKRATLSRKMDVPPPNSYNLSRFPNNKRATTIGFSRQAVKFGTIKSQIDMKAKLPSPGDYEFPSALKSSPFTLKPRLPDNITIQIQRITPGPGRYEPISISANGKYPSSKFRNTRKVLMDTNKKAPQRMQGSGVAPGTYDLFNSDSKYSPEKLEIMRRTRTKPFGTAKRRGPQEKHRLFVPGPGEYSAFSQFDSEYVNEFKRSKTEY